ncbi:hypothetical protein [Thalassotalea agarivorans]|uniref:Cysteine rich repeat-containing protein n=1 Tax=Thalassotalea agarivorans TaxID=349064 RepID=A0A1I0GMG4_THASX|nr:hypothetical protein [Thalassotalea agarivorans]SET71421.1 hypothetical protein SAMN05660429_02478 [Thalassotalea agarivorans]
MARILVFVLGCFVTSSVLASPTANEFVPCKKLAVKLLEHCLADDEDHCWQRSKNAHDKCVSDVFKSHRDPAYLEARKQAEKQLKEQNKP